MELIRKFLTLPKIKDEEEAHLAYLLNLLLWMLVFVPVPYLAYIFIVLPEQIPHALTQSVWGEAVNFILLIMLRRGRVRLTAVLQITLFWLFFTFAAFADYGVQDESYLFGYPLAILIAGLLFGPRAAIGMVVLCLTTGLGMVYAGDIGALQPTSENSAALTWTISLALFPVIAMLQYLSSRTMKHAFERARLSEEKYRLISSVSTDYVFESRVNEKGVVETVWLGGAFEKMTGYTPEEYLSAGGWYAHIHPEDAEKDAKDIQALFNNQDVLGTELRTFAKNGEIRWERTFVHPIWSEEENRLIGAVGAVQDITAQKETEKKLRDILSQQEAILNNIPDMAWLKDLDSHYLAVNEHFLKVSSLKKEDVIGKTDSDIWEKHYADLYRQDDINVVESRKRKTVEELQKDGQGREYWVETTKTPIYDESGTIIGTTGIARDISGHKLAELERERFIAELAAKNAELERFTYTVSHDLKSPLVTITGFLGYIERDVTAGKLDNFSRDISRIRHAVDKMQTLLNELLELSRVGRIVNEPVEEDFGAIVRKALSLLEGTITTNKISVEFVDEGRKIYGDRVRLREVLQNLLENSVKFMGDQPNPEIHIGSIQNEHGVPVFFVKDNGIGVEPQYQDRIFGLFNKLDSTTEGTGIGLTLVKRIIEMHNGSIWVESQPGIGSTFFFTLAATKNQA
ncbi:PAS domain S-box protein [Chloroflexota bacterium]